MKQNRLKNVSIILNRKSSFTFPFMNNYILRRLKIRKDEMLGSKKNFLSVIEFCIKQRQFANDKEKKEITIKYFRSNYTKFKKLIEEQNIDGIKELVYNADNVGQKIGSLILEVFIHYGGYASSKVNELFVPIDRHVKRIFEDSFDISVPNVSVNWKSKSYQTFQQNLKENTAKNINPIVFDYIWFIGKMFCRILDNNNPGNGYRLCSLCWIKDECRIKDKWL